MAGKRKKSSRERDVTARYMAGDFEEDAQEAQERFSDRSAGAQQNKMLRTAEQRAGEQELAVGLESLPVGQVVQVHSLFCDVEHDDRTYSCVVRKTLNSVRRDPIVVGDRVRFRAIGVADEAVVEQVLPRKTVLTRADSFKAIEQQPIVANAEQMLIVAAIADPAVKWGLIDRMIVAARSGGLNPIVCLNKIDLPIDQAEALANLAYYQSLGITTLQSSAQTGTGLETLRQMLAGKTTVLAGHSGVGKSSLINALQPQHQLRVGEISHFTGKGRHTTSSARRYTLDFGGQVIDTPGVKLFGLWGVTEENLLDFFPDVQAETAPPWRVESFKRIAESIIS